LAVFAIGASARGLANVLERKKTRLVIERHFDIIASETREALCSAVDSDRLAAFAFIARAPAVGATLREEFLENLTHRKEAMRSEAAAALLRRSWRPTSPEQAGNYIPALWADSSLRRDCVKLQAECPEVCAAGWMALMTANGLPANAWEGLLLIGKPAVPFLVRALNDANASQQNDIIRLLCRMRKDAIPVLEQMSSSGQILSPDALSAIEHIKAGKKPPMSQADKIGLGVICALAVFIATGVLVSIYGNRPGGRPGDTIAVEAQVDDIHGLGSNYFYYPGHAFATGRGKFIVQASESPAIAVGSVWSIEGKDTRPVSLEIRRSDKDTKPSINFAIKTPNVSITKKTRVRGYVEVDGEVLGNLSHEDNAGGTINIGPDTWLSAVLRCNDIEVSIYPGPS
jgi:hypothetical protein